MRTQEHSTTAAPYVSRRGTSRGEIRVLALGLARHQLLVYEDRDENYGQVREVCAGLLRDHDALKLLTNRELTHHTEMHQPFSRASFGVTVLEIPACGFEWGSLGNGLAIFGRNLASRTMTRGGVSAAILGEVVFLMSNH